jgi:hypothetical protein
MISTPKRAYNLSPTMARRKILSSSRTLTQRVVAPLLADSAVSKKSILHYPAAQRHDKIIIMLKFYSKI